MGREGGGALNLENARGRKDGARRFSGVWFPPDPVARKTRLFRTSEIARAVGVHPNTVRLYEEWGFLPPIPRGPGGYRLYTEEHRDQMILARLALGGEWPGRRIKRSAVVLVKTAAAGDMAGALRLARNHLSLVRAELCQAEAAAAVLAAWPPAADPVIPPAPLGIKDAAALLGLSADSLRNWEKNGLISVPRDARNAYRQYGPAEIARLRVIRLLFQAGFGAAAVLRAVRSLDAGESAGARELLDTPPPGEEIRHSTDRWLSTLADQERRAGEIIRRLEAMRGRAPGGA